MPSQPAGAARRRSRWPYAAAALILVAAAAAWAAKPDGRADPGIRACEELRDGRGAVDMTVRDEAPITESQYRELRAVFAGSRHHDIRDHGTKLVDVVWHASHTTGTSLGYLGPLTEHRSGLQSACSRHGITVTLEPAGAEPAAPA